MNSAGIFFLCFFLLVILPGGAWIGWVRWRAHKSGLPAPPLAAYNPFQRRDRDVVVGGGGRGGGGVMGWLSDKVAGIRNSRAKGYESSRGAANRGFGPLDPDGAWDDRVGHEADASYGRVGGGGGGADYEEQELGLHPGGGGGGYGGHQALPAYGEERGRTRSRDDFSYAGGGQRGLDRRYDEEMYGGGGDGGGGSENPFEDEVGRSELRGVSPRPVEMDGGPSSSMGHYKKTSGDTQSVKSGGRRSMFREDM